MQSQKSNIIQSRIPSRLAVFHVAVDRSDVHDLLAFFHLPIELPCLPQLHNQISGVFHAAVLEHAMRSGNNPVTMNQDAATKVVIM